MALANTDWGIDLTGPANNQHPLNRGLVTWLLYLPGIGESRVIPDLSVAGRAGNTGAFAAGLVATRGKVMRPGGWGSWDMEITTGYIELSSALKIRTVSGPFTFCVWIRPDYAPGTGAEKSVFQWGSPTAVDPRIFLRHSSVVGFVADSSSQALGQTNTSLTWTLGDWFHLGYTNQNLASTGQWYKNGVAIATTANGGTPQDCSTFTAARIGRFLNGDTRGGDAEFDDIRIYDRALSALEMSTLYNTSRNYYQGMLNRLDLAGTAAQPAAAAATAFRRTLSRLGTRTGARQLQGV